MTARISWLPACGLASLLLLIAGCAEPPNPPQISQRSQAAAAEDGTLVAQATTADPVASDPETADATEAAATGLARALPRPDVVLREEAPPEGLVWIEGQQPKRSTARRHGWYDGVRKDELSGGDWLSHFHGEPAEAEYAFDVPAAGSYHFWLRANPVGGPRMEYRLDEGDWQPVNFSDPVQQVNIAADGQPDLRFVAWVDQGSIDLEAGPRTISFRLTSRNNNHGGLDAIVFSREPFTPNYSLRPGQRTGRADDGHWAFEPPPDTLDETALLDLRGLNDTPAGKHGFIRLSEDGESFVDGRGRPIRFWSGTTYVHSRQAPVEEIARWGHFYAKRGINMVRYHGNLVPRQGNDLAQVNEQALDEIFRLVAGMKQAGVYTTVSPFWASSVKHKADWGVPSPKGDSMTGLLFFEPVTQAAYKAWLKELFTRENPYTGVPLKDEPALAIFQIQNEDSLLFWTSQRIEGEALALWRKQFAAWLINKHGSLDAALAAWDGAKHEHDDFANQQAGLFTVWHLTQNPRGGQRKRLADQLEFTTHTMHAFNSMIAQYLRDELGAPQLINAGNWKTANDVKLLDAERFSYTANEIVGVNKYFGVDHQGDRAGHAILQGDQYQSRSALTHPQSIPINAKQPVGHPFIIPESQWVPPNRYQSEGPLVVAAYMGLTGVDSFYWFTIGKGYEPPFGKWDTSTPVQMGMFPAAAVMFRNGYIAEGEPVVHEHRALADIWDRRSSILVEQPGFDPNRDAGDLPPESAVQTGVDPLAFLVGPVRVTYDSDPAATTVTNLDAFIDREQGVVESITRQIRLDHRRGVLSVDAPRAQAAAGFLQQVSPIRLSDVELKVGNPYAAVYVVSLDTRNLNESENILVQASTIARPYGFAEQPVTMRRGDREVEGHRITELGTSPWNLENNDLVVTLTNPHIHKALVLDANGFATAELELETDGDRRILRFPPDALYVILR